MSSPVQEKSSPGEDFSSRLNWALDRPGFKAAGAARAANVSPAYVSELRSGKKFNPAPKVIADFASYLGVGYRWLAYGEGSPENVVSEELANYKADSDGSIQVINVPVISWTHAGQATEYEELPKSWTETIPSTCRARGAFALRVQGDSMEPRCLHGDFVVVMPFQQAHSGALVVAKLKRDGVVLRRLSILDGNRVRLSPYNPLYPATEHSLEDFHWIYPVHSTLRLEAGP